MRILLIGSGGREHALAWRLVQSPHVEKVYVAPGNGGTALLAASGEKCLNVEIADSDIDGLVNFARNTGISLVVPGPEAPLVAGVADAFAAVDIPCFGPDGYCAQLEGSKAFAKEVMLAAGVPTASYAEFTDYDAALAHIESTGVPIVIKADGLAAGKGVIVAQSMDEARHGLTTIMQDNAFGSAGAKVVIEECLVGEEVSLLAFVDGERFAVMPATQDHKQVFDGDTGPNTGGMGAYSPAPILLEEAGEAMAEQVIAPVVRHMAAQGHPFRGVLYAGLMMTADGPKVLEYNTRFGDPECQPLMLRFDADLAEAMLACAQGRLAPALVRFSPRTALGVVLAAGGYPGSYEKGHPIAGIAEAEERMADSVAVFHAGTRLQNGTPVTSGGRVLCVTALGDTLAEAQATAYAAAQSITFEGMYKRTDIGVKGIRRLQQGKG